MSKLNKIESIETKSIFSILLVVNIIVSLAPLWRGSFLLDYFSSPAEFEKRMDIFLALFNFGFMVLGIVFHLIYYPKIEKFNFFVFSALFISYLISIALNSFKSGYFSIIFTPICYLFIFFIIGYYYLPTFIEKYIRFGILLWSIIPVCLVLFTHYTYNEYFFSTPRYPPVTFGGFAAHQNAYGYLTGVGILIGFFKLYSSKWNWILLAFSFVGIYMAESRSALIGTIICSIYYFINKNSLETKINEVKIDLSSNKKSPFLKSRTFKIIGILLIVLIFFGIIYYWINYGTRKNTLMEAGYRAIIYEGFINYISDHFLFGNGGGYMLTTFRSPQGTPAHNFVIQSLADYGIFVTFFFLLFIFLVWKQFKLYGRCLLLYMIIFGLFQPYFNGFGILSGNTLVTYLLGIYYDNLISNE